MKKQNRVSVAFFGDGAVDEGVLYESVNFAVLKRLPVIYVYENNGFSVCSRVSARQVGDSIFHLMPSNLMYTKAVDGNSVLDVYEAARVAVKRARDGHGPAFIECKTYRMRGHAGVGSDAKLGYRTAQEIAEWEAKCPVDVFRDKLLAQGLITRQEIQKMESEINLEIDEAFQFAQASPLPSRDDLLCYLFEE
jgi:pyruvate dehydrogenase E1 component alpha subunit